MVLQPPAGRNRLGLGCFAFARHYLRNHCYFLLLRLLRCFSSAGLLSFDWCTFSTPGCPIRKSWDIMCICHSPKLIAAYHVLLRLQDPRHPPYALNYFLFACANHNAVIYTRILPLKWVKSVSRVFFIVMPSKDNTTSVFSFLCLFQYVKELRSIQNS